jgi:hypothetical protein
MSRKRRMAGTAVYGTVRTVVREDGGRKPSSYPITASLISVFLLGATLLRLIRPD